MSCSGPVEHQIALRSIGAFALLAGLIEFIIGIVVYTDLTSPQTGAWWAGIVTMFASLLGVLSLNKGVVIATCVFTIIAVIVGAAGCIIDGVVSAIQNTVVTCISSDGTLTGDSNYYSQVSLWCGGLDHDCACSAADSATCFIYEGGIAASSCNNVLTEYTSALNGTVAMDVIATVAVLALSITTCVSLCSPAPVDSSTTTVVMTTPAQVVVLTPQQQMVPVQVQYQQVPVQQGQYQQQIPGQAYVIDQPKA